jgi:hypothetical protein
MASNGLITVNNKLGKAWRETLWPNLRYYHGTCLDGLKKTMRTSIRIINVPAHGKLLQWLLKNRVRDTMAGSYGHGNESSSSTKDKTFLPR